MTESKKEFEVPIYNSVITVEIVEDLEDYLPVIEQGWEIYGIYIAEEYKILLKKVPNADFQERTFLHEITHAIKHLYGMSSSDVLEEEYLCEFIASHLQCINDARYIYKNFINKETKGEIIDEQNF